MMLALTAAMQLLTEACKALKAYLELLRLEDEKEDHSVRRSPPRHLKETGRGR